MADPAVGREPIRLINPARRRCPGATSGSLGHARSRCSAAGELHPGARWASRASRGQLGVTVPAGCDIPARARGDANARSRVLGFAPQRERRGEDQVVFRLGNCPYREAVRANQPVVCELHRGLRPSRFRGLGYSGRGPRRGPSRGGRWRARGGRSGRAAHLRSKSTTRSRSRRRAAALPGSTRLMLASCAPRRVRGRRRRRRQLCAARCRSAVADHESLGPARPSRRS